MHICVVSGGYPFKNQNSYTFVKQLCEAFADLGIKVSVISPRSITKRLVRNAAIEPRFRTEYTAQGNPIEVYTPLMLSFGALGSRGNINFKFFRQAVIKTLKTQFTSQPDVLYGHFWHSAYAVYPYAKHRHIPLFVATGESAISLHKMFPPSTLGEFADYVNGVVCVSTKNMVESIDNGLTIQEKCKVVPNAIDPNKFKFKDKAVLREAMGFKSEDFIVAFVGAFIHRKGADRVGEAINCLGDSSIKSIFIGKTQDGTDAYLPKCDGILHMGPVQHDKIADYLNCADVFVLPTLNEGCCNAIVEAMACGLPIVSSDKSFNYDILDTGCSILVDPLNVKEIADAIALIKSDVAMRSNLQHAALQKASQLTICKRADNIVAFIKSRM